MNLLVIALSALSLRTSLQNHQQQARTALENLSLVLERDIASSYDKVNLGLQDLVDTYAYQVSRRPFDRENWNRTLLRQRTYHPLLNALRATDAAGNILYGLEPGNATGVNLADRDYFTRMSQDPAVGVVIAGPLFGRSSRVWGLALVRRLNTPQGAFGGIVLAIIPLEHFRQLFAQLKLGSNVSITFSDQSRRVLVRYPGLNHPEKIEMATLPGEAAATLSAGAEQGSYSLGENHGDGIARMHSYRRNSVYGFHIDVGFAEQDYLGEWRNELQNTLGLATIFALVTSLLGWNMNKSWQRQRAVLDDLKQSEMHFRTLAEIAPVGVYRTSASGEFTYVNDHWRDISGMPAEQAMGRGWLASLHPADKQHISNLRHETARSKSGFKTECRLVKPDGRIVWIYCQAQPECAESGEVRSYVGTLTDITEQKLQQDTLERQVLERTAQLRALTMELTTTEERERQAIAHELHDGLCQAHALAKLKLSELNHEDCQRWAELKPQITAIETLIDQADQVARSLSLQLSPAALQALGLVPALEWLADEIRRTYGLQVNVLSDEAPRQIDEVMRNPLFRATRELLINVAKHAKVATVDVVVKQVADQLVVSVTDAGVGFVVDPGSLPSDKGGYGLFSVRERIGFIGGDMQIDSHPGDGTVVVLTVPLTPPRISAAASA